VKISDFLTLSRWQFIMPPNLDGKKDTALGNLLKFSSLFFRDGIDDLEKKW